jgi:putative SOS response-associated peptidase YedK
MGIAGIYRKYSGPDGREMFAFSMLTVNADDHPFMRRFHAPNDEKRMVVILDSEDFEQWLTCPVAEAKERFASNGMVSLSETPHLCQNDPGRLPRLPP